MAVVLKPLRECPDPLASIQPKHHAKSSHQSDSGSSALRIILNSLSYRVMIVRDRVVAPKPGRLPRGKLRKGGQEMRILRGLEIGDRIRIQGMTGVVVALISEGKFSPDHPAEEWAYLETGILVDTDEAGLIHYADLDGITIEKISN